MEAAVSAIVGDLINRALCFLIRKYYTDKAGEEDRLRRLNQLLLRILAVVEEADGRYITNSAMLKQLELLAESMYRGYHMLDTFKHQSQLLDESAGNKEEVRSRLPAALSMFPFCSNNKRSRTVDNTIGS